MMRIFLLLGWLLKPSWGFSIDVRRRPEFEFTGIKKELTWKLKTPPIKHDTETRLNESGVLIQRGEFGHLSEERIDEIRQTCEDLGMSLLQGMSVRKQTMVTRTIHSSSKLRRNSRKLSELLSSGTDILELSVHYDQPPVAIMRAILDYRIQESHLDLDKAFCKKIVKSIIADELMGPHLDQFLSFREQQALLLAKQSDNVSFVKTYDTTEQEAATAWEQVLHDFLDSHNVNFMTEQNLREAGASRTPDCLILDDCYINGRLVRWVDSKNFYGSASAQHYMKSIRKQIQNYESEFADTGAIVYRHGFSTLLADGLPGTLLLDQGPLKALDGFDEV